MMEASMTVEIDRRYLLKGAVALTLGPTLSSAAVQLAAAAELLKVGSFFIAIDYAPYLIAKSKGMFENIGGNSAVQYTTFQSLPPVNEALATQQVDAVFEAEPPALIGRAAGIDVKIVGISCSLEHVPPELNRQDSHGVLDRRFYRH
jgi:ABC-type nitrate/sulfonate/bicarbonate transport system substrate-binding protein